MNASVKKRAPAEVDNSVSIDPSPLSTSVRTPLIHKGSQRKKSISIASFLYAFSEKTPFTFKLTGKILMVTVLMKTATHHRKPPANMACGGL